MNCINLTINGKPVQLIVHDDGHEGLSFNVMALLGKHKAVRFGRFERLEHARMYCEKYAAYYKHVKFFVSESLF